MEIRYATAEDYASFIVLEAEIQAQHHLGAPGKFPPTGVIAPEDFRALLARSDEKILVAVEAGTLVAYLQYELVDEPGSYYTYPEKLLYVEVLTVKATHRRRGIGEALLAHAEAAARAFGASRITLDVWAFNDGAIRFYERAGFTPIRHLLSKPVAADE